MANPNTDETEPAGGTGGPGDNQSPSGQNSGPPAPPPPPPPPGSQVNDDDKKWLNDTYNQLFGRPPSAAEAADLQRMHDIHGSDASNYRDYYASQVLGPRSNNAPGTGQQGTAINYGNYNPRTGQGSPNGTAPFVPPSPYTPDIQNQLREWDKVFVQHLGRHLTRDDVAANWNPSQPIPSLEAIRASVLASPEYKKVTAGGTTPPTTPTTPGTPSPTNRPTGTALFNDAGQTTLAGADWFQGQSPDIYQPFTEEFNAPTKPQGINDVWNRGFTAPRVMYDAQGNRQIMHGNYLANVGGGPQGQPGAAGAPWDLNAGGVLPHPTLDSNGQPVWGPDDGRGSVGPRDSASAQTPISDETGSAALLKDWVTSQRAPGNPFEGGLLSGGGSARPGGGPQNTGTYYDPRADPNSPQYDPVYAQDKPGGQQGGTYNQTKGAISDETGNAEALQNDWMRQHPGSAFDTGMQSVGGANGQQLSDFESVDPGYDFRIKEAQKAMERGAAARGTLLTGGTQKAIGRDIQDYASNEYQNIYNRDLGEYGTAYGIFGNERANKQGTYAEDYNRAMQEYMNRYQIGSQNQLNKIGSQRNNMLDTFGMSMQNRLASDDEMRQAFDIWHSLDSDYYNRLFQLSGSGLSASGALGNMGGQISDYMSQLGNIRAAGTIGAANAMNRGLSNIGQNMWLPSIIQSQRT